MNAYRMSAKERSELADCVKNLPIGYIKSRDPGDLSNAIMNDYAMLETTNTHCLPQLIASIILPSIIFVSLLFVNWKMSLAMIAAIHLTSGGALNRILMPSVLDPAPVLQHTFAFLNDLLTIILTQVGSFEKCWRLLYTFKRIIARADL